MTERLFRRGVPQLDGVRRQPVFDPATEGGRHGLGLDVSLAIWEYVARTSTDLQAQRDEARAQQRFHEIAARVASRGGQLGPAPGGTTFLDAESLQADRRRFAMKTPDPGRLTLVEAQELERDPRRDQFGDIAPGRMTLEELERHHWNRLAPATEAETASDLAEPLHKDDVDALLGSLRSGAPSSPSPEEARPPEVPPRRVRGTLAAFDVHAHVRSPDVNALRVISPHDATRAAVHGEVLTIAHALGLAPGTLEIAIDDRARARLTAAGVRGMQEGQIVYLHPDVYRPDTEDGRYLLAHELVHLAQRRLPARPRQGYRAAEAEATSLGRLYARGHGLTQPTIGLGAARSAHDEPGTLDEKLLADPPAVTRSVQMLHVYYEPLASGATWTGGLDKKREALAMVLKDLVGAAYSVKLLDELVAAVGGLHAIDVAGSLSGQATQKERITRFGVSCELMLGFVAWLSAPPRNLTSLSEAQTAVLQAGVDVDETWPDMQPELPAWATQALYAGFMGVTQATLLTKYGQAKRLMRDRPSDANAAALAACHTQVLAAISPSFRAMDAVRTDKVLAESAAYRVLWDLPVVPAAANTEVALANADSPAPLRPGLLFLVDADAYPALAKIAPADPRARRQLLDRLKARLGSQGIPADGDFVLHDGPVHNVRSPLASSMTSYPALEAPFFDTPRGGDREFLMNLEFPDVFEAFRGYVYQWELIHVDNDDDEQLSSTADTLSKRGARPDQRTVLDHRLGRDAEYGRADIRRSIDALEGELGPAGISAVNLAASNAMLRMVGTVIKTFVETLVKPHHEKTIPFAKDGLYVVRCIAWPRPLDGAVLDRAASVSWLPVWVRPARDMSKLRADLDRTMTEGAGARLQEVGAQLADESLSPDARATLEEERQRIERAQHAQGNDLLDQEKQGLLTAQQTAEGAQKQAIAKRLAEIEQILQMRAQRIAGAKTDGSLEGALRIPAAFVGDNGQTLRPLFEVFQQRSNNAQLTYHAVDSTTKNSGHRAGTGKTREDAIATAIQAILESDQGYGRGYVTLTIPPAPPAQVAAASTERTVRIEKSLGSLMTEAVENAAAVASVAAIAAAPFTGGASLALLVPLSIVGAVPSAYRLIDRGQQGTLRLDMATVMDVVNILGAAVGAGQASAAGRAALRGMPLGKGWVFLGLGTDGLGMMVVGAGVIEQINELAKDAKLPPGLRNAMIAQILGQQLLQLGIAAGAQLYMHGKTQQEHFRGQNVVDHPLIEQHLQDEFRAVLGPEGEAIPVYRDLEGKQVAGAGVEIHYERDGYGLPTELRVIAGPAAGAAELRVHAKAAKAMLEYQGLIGYLRNLYDRVITLFKSGALPPKPGSRAWEARLEIQTKLPQAINQIYADLASGKISPEAAASRINDLRQQMLAHERALNEVGEGQGFIAAHDGATKRAVSLGYPSPPSDHFYFETEEGQFQLQRNVDSDAEPYHLTWREGRPYVVPGPAPSAARTVDVTVLRAHTAAWLAVGPEHVALHADPAVEHVTVRPPATADGPYEIVYKPGTPETEIHAAIDAHRELAARRPDPDHPRPSTDRPWTSRDENAYQGNQYGRRRRNVDVAADEAGGKVAVEKLIKAGQLDNAVDYICQAYGYTDRNMRVVIAELVSDEWANVTGEIGSDNIQTMTLSRRLFDQGYTFIVRTIGHEYQHVLQRSQKVPIRDQNEREFLAWSWEALDTSGPQYDLPTAAEHARAALEFYTLMPHEKQKEYEPRMKQLVALIQRLIDELTARGL